jgi:hypothetical protein
MARLSDPSLEGALTSLVRFLRVAAASKRHHRFAVAQIGAKDWLQPKWWLGDLFSSPMIK